jgi:hypothetical protein
VSNCIHCDRPIERTSNVGRPPSYCSVTCRTEAATERAALWRSLGQLVELRTKEKTP